MEKKRIFKNALYLFIGNNIAKLLTAVSTILVTRIVAPKSYALFAISIAFASITSYFADLGLNHTFIREGSRKDSDLSNLVWSSLRIRSIFIIVSIILLTIITQIFYQSKNELNYLILFSSIPSIIGIGILGVSISYFQVIEKMQYVSLFRFIVAFLIFSFLMVCNILKLDILYYSLFFGLANLLGGLISFFILIKFLKKPKKMDYVLLKDLLWFTLNGGFMIFIPQMGPIILERVSSILQSGYFSVAYRFPSLLYIIPITISSAFYPALFKQAHISIIKTNEILKFEMQIIFSFSLFVALPFIIAPELIILIIYGSKYNLPDVILTLRILSFVIPLQSINIVLADRLTVTNLQHKRAIIVACSALIGLGAIILLGLNFGAVGGSFAMIIIELSMFTILFLNQPDNFTFLTSAVKPFSLFSLSILVALLLKSIAIPNWLYLIISVIFFGISIVCFEKKIRGKIIEYAKRKKNGN